MVASRVRINVILDNVDLFTAALLEEPVRNGLVGPTFGCLLADQFRRLRDGDRYIIEEEFSTLI